MKRTVEPAGTFSGKDTFQHRLNLYSLAASAAGVSLLALAQPSHAEIVYTPQNQLVGRNGSYYIDLNHDGIADFFIFDQFTFSSRGSSGFWDSNFVKILPTRGDKVLGRDPLPLKPGEKMGPERSWYAASGGAILAASFGYNGDYSSGLWRNQSNRYLGLEFQIKGETHFGWARLSVKWIRSKQTFEVSITGFAYETVPHKAILAGQTQEDSAPVEASVPISLGPLALGSRGISLWRPGSQP